MKYAHHAYRSMCKSKLFTQKLYITVLKLIYWKNNNKTK